MISSQYDKSRIGYAQSALLTAVTGIGQRSFRCNIGGDQDSKVLPYKKARRYIRSSADEAIQYFKTADSSCEENVRAAWLKIIVELLHNAIADLKKYFKGV